MLLANQNTDSDYLQCIILELGKLPTLVQYCHNFTTTMYLLVLQDKPHITFMPSALLKSLIFKSPTAFLENKICVVLL